MKIRTWITGMTLTAGFCMASEQPRPNLLILLTDDQRPDTLGCYDRSSPIPTPNLDRLADQGVRFLNGFVTSPICVVSRASILTGRYGCNVKVHQFNVPIPDEIFADSYPAHLKQAGYFVGALGKYGVGISPVVTDTFDVFEAQAGQGPQFREYQGRKMHDSEWLTVKTEEFLNQVPEGQPFVLQVNYKAPHGSSCPAPEDDHLLDHYRFPLRPTDDPESFAKLPPYVQTGLGGWTYLNEFNNEAGDNNPYQRDYFEKIVSVDRSVGRIRYILAERGLAENTVIIFLSDHGIHLGEKQLFGKWTPYDQSLRIPFIVYDPRPAAQKGGVRPEMVLNIDVAPTLLDLAGIPVSETMDGRSLVPLITRHPRPGAPPWRDHFFFEHYTSPAAAPRYIPRSIGWRTESEKYIQWMDPDPILEEFYRLDRDPLESHNLLNCPESQEQIEAARNKLAIWIQNNPPDFHYDPYGDIPQYGCDDIDWDRFRQVRPEEYTRIKAEVERLGVTWKQAVDDWEIRYEICVNAGYWY
jgi:arylsulfatase A-like enzyme